MCVVAQVRVSSGMKVLAANSHSSQKYDEFSSFIPVGSSHIQDMGGAEGKAAYIGTRNDLSLGKQGLI